MSLIHQRSFLTLYLSKVALLICLGCQSSVTAQEAKISIIPAPVSMQVKTGSFTLSNATTIGVPKKPADVSTVAAYFADKIKLATGFNLRMVNTGDASIQLIIKSTFD